MGTGEKHMAVDEGSGASLRTWLAVIGAAVGTFMAVINIQIVNASLPDIRSALGAGANDGGWIVTAYMVAEIIVIPMCGWLSRVFSVRRYLVVNAALFLVFSVACAAARDLDQMIVLRVLQGLSGGVLIPMAFTLVITLLPPSQRPIGLAIFAFSATFAPCIGPTLGGWLNDHWGWQYVFYVNLPPGIVMIGLLWLALERQPMQLGLLRHGDWAGIVAMAVGLGALQVVLEEGNEEGWFDSPFILRLTVLAACALCLFVRIELSTPHPLLNLRLLRRRNFGLGVVAMFLVGAALYGSIFMLPLYLSRVQGYNAEQIGLVLVWTGIPQLFLIPFLPWLMRRFDPRWLVCAGCGLFAGSAFLVVGMTADVGADQLLLPDIVRALGVALLLTPLSALAVAGIAPEDAGTASGLVNAMRNLGGAIGIASLQTFLDRRESFHFSIVAEQVSLFDEKTRERLAVLARAFERNGVTDPGLAWYKAVAEIGDSLRRQAYVMAVDDAFYVVGMALVVALAAALLLGRPVAGAAAAGE